MKKLSKKRADPRKARRNTKEHEGDGIKRMSSGHVEVFQKEEVYQIIGAAIDVHKELGNGFLEAVYQEALEIELSSKNIPHKSQVPLRIKYKNSILNKEYVADLLCFDNIIVEIKALSKLGGNEDSQILNYLKASGLKVGLLINFGSHGKLEWKRLVF